MPPNIIAKGMGVVPGRIEGIAKWASADGSNIEEGDILLASMTDAKMIRGIYRAEGVVTETGGRTSHAAVVALASGKTTIVGAGNLKGRIKDGDRLIIDGATGQVERI